MSAHTEAVEAAARALFMRGWDTPKGMLDDEFFASRKYHCPRQWALAQEEAAAALPAYLRHMRAAGYVVTKVPEETTPLLGDYARGWNDFHAHVLANAVEVPE